MSHQIYHTEAFVIGSVSTGEANKFILLFTRELGTVGATAQSVRSIASKLRYSLQDFSYSAIDLVRGKSAWRITNARRHDDFALIFDEPAKLRAYVKVLAYIRRLAAHEEPNEELFDLILGYFRFLAHTDLSATELEDFELATSLGMLGNLGYLRDFAGSAELLATHMSLELLQFVRAKRSMFLREAEAALIGSQL